MIFTVTSQAYGSLDIGDTVHLGGESGGSRHIVVGVSRTCIALKRATWWRRLYYWTLRKVNAI